MWTKKLSTDEVDSQRQRFIETARALGTDEDEVTFKAMLAVIARQKPKDEPKGTLKKSAE